MDKNNQKQETESHFESQKLNYIFSIVSSSSAVFSTLTPQDCAENREIFNFLYEKLSPLSKIKLARYCLSGYNPDLQYAQIEKDIISLGFLTEGSKDSSLYKETVPFLHYIYKEKNNKLFAYLRDKYQLKINETYPVERVYKIRDSKTGKEMEKQETYETNIVDLAFNRCFLSFSKNIEEGIAPLTPQDIKEVGLSKYTKLRLQSLKKPNSGTRNFGRLSVYKEVERFIDMAGSDLIPEVGEGICKFYIKDIVALDFQSDANKKTVAIENISKSLKLYEKKYASVFSQENFLRLERYAVFQYKEHIVGQIAASMKEANKELDSFKGYSSQEKMNFEDKKIEKLNLIIEQMENNKEAAWQGFDKNFNYRGHDKASFFKGLSLLIEEKRNSKMSYQREIASPATFGLDRAGHFTSTDLQKLALFLETIPNIKSTPRQLHKI